MMGTVLRSLGKQGTIQFSQSIAIAYKVLKPRSGTYEEVDAGGKMGNSTFTSSDLAWALQLENKYLCVSYNVGFAF